MGMFDVKSTGKPMYAEDLYARSANMLSDQLAPGIKRTTGYENPNRKAKRMAMAIADQADTTNIQSIKDTHRQLQQINPTAASAWLKEAINIFTAQNQSLTAQAAYRNSLGKKKEEKESDVPQMTASEDTRIGDLVDDAFDFGVWDFGGVEAKISKKAMTDFVGQYAQRNNATNGEVIEGILNGNIIPPGAEANKAPAEAERFNPDSVVGSEFKRTPR